MFNSEAEQEIFLKHLRHLFSLHREGRRKRLDWQTLVDLVKQDGHWRVKSNSGNIKKDQNTTEKTEKVGEYGQEIPTLPCIDPIQKNNQVVTKTNTEVPQGWN